MAITAKNLIKKYALLAKAELMKAMANKANLLNIPLHGKDFGDEESQLKALHLDIAARGYERVMEEAASNCFNLFNMFYFMEVNGYLPSCNQIFSGKNANNQFRSFLKSILPQIFQNMGNHSHILFPDNIFSNESPLYGLAKETPTEDWKSNVQIIGWLYQYYNSSVKDKVFEELKRNIKISKEKIAVATQIFTPDWIVRYMVENSLGRLWIEGHKNSELKYSWKYYLNEAEQENSAKTELDRIREGCKRLRPKDIKCIDPCMGSGNILCYLFDLLMEIYKEAGYKTKEAVESILKNNLLGLDIDEKAFCLAYFALIMKARQYDEDFFSRNIFPRVYAIKESNNIDNNLIEFFSKENRKLKQEVAILVEEMKNACEFGSLLRISKLDFNSLYARVEEIVSNDSPFKDRIIDEILPLIQVGELLYQKYHVVVTNPPYMGGGGMNQSLANFVKQQYPLTKADLFSAFMERGLEMLEEAGYSSMVTMQNWMFIPSFEAFRKKIINEYSLTTLLHLENMVMRIAFGTAVSVIRKAKIPNYIGCYNQIKYSDIVDEQPISFPVKGNRTAYLPAEKFNLIPGSPVAYWADSGFLETYKKGVIGDYFDASVGIQTGNNDRFLKYWFEVPFEEIDFDKNKSEDYKKLWYPHPKGGAFRKWYGNYDYVVNWQNNGEEIKKLNNSNISIKKYNREGICWSHTTNGAFSARKFYKSSIPNIENPVLFCDEEKQKLLLAFLNTKVADYILNMVNSTIHYHVGDILNLPLLEVSGSRKIEDISDESVELAKMDWDSYELSWNFLCHPLKNKKMKLLSKAYDKWYSLCLSRYEKLVANERHLNEYFIKLYKLEKELTPDVEEKFISIRKPELKRTIVNFLSYAVGCIFGRYSLDYDGIAYAGGIWKSNRYKSYIPEETNIILLTQSKSLSEDIIAKLEAFLSALYGKNSLEANLDFIASALGDRRDSRQVIRKYFLNNFFTDHCKLYKKHPVYWLLDSGKNAAFKCLVYSHRYNEETLFNIKKNCIKPMLSDYVLMLNEIKELPRKSLVYKEKKKLNKTEKVIKDKLEELSLYEKKISFLASAKINVDLNQGIKANYSLFQTVLAKIK